MLRILEHLNGTLGRWICKGNKGLPGTWVLKKQRDKVGKDEKMFCYWVSSAKVIHSFIYSFNTYLLRAYPVRAFQNRK